MAKAGKYSFKKGVVCDHYGSNNIITNDDLTDDIAKHLIDKKIMTKEQFNIKNK